jgi:hypothetical protein
MMRGYLVVGVGIVGLRWIWYCRCCWVCVLLLFFWYVIKCLWVKVLWGTKQSQRSGCGIVCGHAMDAMLGSRLWNHLRIVEFGLVLIVNRYLLIDVCSCSGGKSLCVIMPLIALRLFLLKLSTKSGIALALRSQHLSPLLVISSCAICSEWCGSVSVLKIVF